MTTNCERCGDIWDEIMDVCHSCAARLVMWLTGAHPPIRAQWRRRSRDAMLRVVKSNRTMAETDPAALLKLVDAAYPFGERAMYPYKAWLAERKLLVEVLLPPKLPPEPTAEDHAAVEVAIDLVETGREDEARKLLDEQAPRRLNRACPACGAKVGKACVDAETAVGSPVTGIVDRDGAKVPITVGQRQATKREPRIVPHLARVEPQRPAPMPLFERSEP